MYRLVVPVVFVLLWSTGFVVARLVAPHADLDLFLAVRFLLASAVFAAIVLLTRRAWPTRDRVLFHLACGALLHGGYLIGSYWAIGGGLAVGAMALLGATQPLLTAVFAATVQRVHVSRAAWIGLAVGLGGVVLLLSPALLRAGAGSVSGPVVFVAILSVVALTVGTLLQRAHAVAEDLLSVGSLQHLGAAVVALAALAALGEIRWTGGVVVWGALLWGVLFLSVGATSLLIFMVRHDGAAKTSTLMLLVPPLAALLAFFVFGETLTPIQLVGFVLALLGVLVVRRELQVPTVSRQR
jgi:drug/metabolite transporter (DMT)-like permease